MTVSKDQIEIQQFANRNVITLPEEASIGEVIRLMYRQGIRHIPILSESKIVGIVNPRDVLGFIADETFEMDFDQDLKLIMSEDYKLFSPESSLFDVVADISADTNKVALVEIDGVITGIFTEIDILNTEFLWANIKDTAITSSTGMGQVINEFQCTTADNSIRESIRLMVELEQDYIGIISNDNKDLRGVLSFFEIAHHLYIHTYRKGTKLDELLNLPLHTIFPSSGVYYIEPVMLSQMRSDLWVNDSFFAVVLNDTWEPKLIITIHEIIAYLIDNSDYFGNNDA